jgi:hypothetical protein
VDTTETVLIGLFFTLVVGTFAYTIFRLWRGKEPGQLDPMSQKLARVTGYPRFFDPLLARSMTSREKWGWGLVLAIAIVAIVFTGK